VGSRCRSARQATDIIDLGGVIRSRRFTFRLLSDKDYADALVIRKVRNRFSHADEIMGFEKPEIAKLVSKMTRPQSEPSWAYDWYFKRLHEIGLHMIDAIVREREALRRGWFVVTKGERWRKNQFAVLGGTARHTRSSPGRAACIFIFAIRQAQQARFGC
jgi:hypothetical protein